MAEREPPAVDADQARLLRVDEREAAGGERRHRALDHGRALGVVGRGGEQREPRRRGQARDALVEHALQPARHRQRLRQRLVACELGGAQRGRQLDQRERVAVRLLEQALAHLRRRRGGRVGEQLGGRRVVEPLDGVRRHVGRLEHADVALARAEQEHDALRVEAAGDELQGLRRAGVEPVRVVDEAQHRPLLGQLGEQRQAAGVDEEALLAAAVGEPERGAERRRLRRRQPVEISEPGPQQLVQRRERELGLGLHPARVEHVHVARAGARVVEQDRLADARLAAQRQRAAPRVAGRVEQCADEGALSVPPKQHRPTLPTDVATI